MSPKISYIYLLILPFILWNHCVYSQDWLKDTCELNGAVRFVEYESKGGAMPSKKSYEYNRQGFLVNWDGYWTGFLAGHNGKYRVFDESGTRCLKESRAYDNEVSQQYKMSYNDNGQLDKQILFNSGAHWSTFNYRYDESGKLIEEFVVIQSDLDTNYHYYEYDSEGRLIMESEIRTKCKNIKTWKYDKNGVLLEEIFLDTNWTSATYNEQDENGNWVEVKRIDYSEKPNTSDSYIETFEYNEKGQLIKEYMTDIDGTPRWESVKTYDQNGLLIAEKSTNLKDEKDFNYTYQYKFDTQGNWIKKITKVNGELEETEKRKITYY